MSEFFEFKHYRILEEIGSGGLGKVFKAVDLRNGRPVAVKILHKKYQSSRRFLGIFHRELLIISRLKNKHIVECIDANFEPPNCYIVTEFVDGWSLYTLIKRFEKIPPLVALSIGIDILQGIDYLHLHDTIHSDLSAPNVLIDKTGRVLVTDFGLSIETGVEDYKDSMIGTPGYYSPEHVSETAVNQSSDIYCAGLLIYEMITGKKAVLPHKDRKDIMSAMKKIDFRPLQAAIPERNLARSVTQLLKSTLSYQESKRPSGTEIFMFEIYQMLRRYHIRYSKHAVRQYLADQGLTEAGPITGQSIYLGERLSKPRGSQVG